MKLDCHECGHTTVLEAQEQADILRELTQPSHAKIVECPCGKTQFILGARRKESR